MANLDIAAGTALEKLKELLPRIEKAEDDCARATEAIGSAAREVEDAWQELEAEAEAFRDRQDRRTRDMAAAREQRLERVEGLSGRLEDVRDEVRDRSASAVEELEELGESAEDVASELRDMLERVEEAAESFEERAEALAQRFEAAMDGLERFLEEEVAPGLDRVRDEVEDRCEALRGYVAGECTSRVEEIAAQAEATLDRAAGELEHKLAEAAALAAAFVRKSVEQLLVSYERAEAGVEQLAGRAEEALESLGETLDATAAEIREQENPLAEGAERIGQALHELHEGVNGRLEFFARFTFL